MTTLVINLHGRRDLDGIVYVGARRLWRPGQLLAAHPLHSPHLVDEPCRARGCHGIVHTRSEAIGAYGQRLLANPDLLALVPALRGRTLGCWCAPALCHGHVLAVLAEAPVLEYRPTLQHLAGDPRAALPAAV